MGDAHGWLPENAERELTQNPVTFMGTRENIRLRDISATLLRHNRNTQNGTGRVVRPAGNPREGRFFA